MIINVKLIPNNMKKQMDGVRDHAGVKKER